jgi:hypothetical protein
MKIVISELGGAVSLPDGSISIGVKCGEEVHTIEVTPKARGQLLLPLLASAGRDPFEPNSFRLKPVGLGRFQIREERGLSFLLAPDVALHVQLLKPLADHLLQQLQTWDDPSTWKAPTKQ